jgi:hypothetical protein
VLTLLRVYNFTVRALTLPHLCSDLICASIRNDLGVLLKARGQLAEAKTHYTTALKIRS